jgi:hypothetical protein
MSLKEVVAMASLLEQVKGWFNKEVDVPEQLKQFLDWNQKLKDNVDAKSPQMQEMLKNAPKGRPTAKPPTGTPKPGALGNAGGATPTNERIPSLEEIAVMNLQQATQWRDSIYPRMMTALKTLNQGKGGGLIGAGNAIMQIGSGINQAALHGTLNIDINETDSQRIFVPGTTGKSDVVKDKRFSDATNELVNAFTALNRRIQQLQGVVTNRTKAGVPETIKTPDEIKGADVQTQVTVFIQVYTQTIQAGQAIDGTHTPAELVQLEKRATALSDCLDTWIDYIYSLDDTQRMQFINAAETALGGM